MMSGDKAGFSQSEAAYLQFSQSNAQGHEDLIQSVASPSYAGNQIYAKVNKMDRAPKMHINPNFSVSSQKVLVNPNFKSRSGTTGDGGTVHINPKFKPSPPTSPKTKTIAKSSASNVHVNPKFTSRPLPPVPSTSKTPVKPQRTSASKVSQKVQFQTETEPIYANIHLNPSFSTSVSIDQKKKIEFEQAIRNRVEVQPPPKVLVNPRFKKQTSATETVTSDNGRKVRPEKPKRHSLYTPNIATPIVSSTPANSKSIIEEKENVPSTSAKSSRYNLFTPLRKTAFRKIGTKKLVRVKSKSPTAHTPLNHSFKKIGSKKLIRIRKNTEKSADKSSPARTYKVKTKTKIVKKTPTNPTKSRFSFVTPMSLRKHKFMQRNSSTKLAVSGGKTVGTPTKKRSFRDRFRLDRRPKHIFEPNTKKKVISKKPSQSKLKSISGSLYHVSPTCIKKSAPIKPNRTTQTYRQKPAAIIPSLAANKFITVQGVRFSVADNGRKLKRLPDIDDQSTAPATTPFTSPASSQASPTNPPTRPSPTMSEPPMSSNLSRSASTRSASNKRVYLGGEEFDEFQPGVFTRSRHSLTRQSLTQAKQRSINIILKSQNRSKQYCMFYNKFGKCTKRDKGSCPFIHDKDKIAVCRRFLKGACLNTEACLLSHKVAPEKMPTCKFFLEGVCTAEDCPYQHVKVNAQADICASFLKGYCVNGADCKQRHVMACPDFDKTGLCRKGEKCPFPHVDRTGGKKKPPAKPKRKSLGMTPDHSLQKKSRVAQRYYHDNLDQDIADVKADKEATKDMSDVKAEATKTKEDLEAKRKRLLKKIEVAKQGWSKPNAEDENMKNMDDSGPYENIDGDSSEDEIVTRAPIGQLGDFISIAGYSSEEEETNSCGKDRLI